MKSAPKAPDPVKTANAQYQYTKKAAEDSLKSNSMDRTGPYGSSTFERDANGMPVGITSSLSPELQGASSNLTGSLQSQSGLLPSSINFDDLTAEDIARRNYGAYSAMTAPDREQQRNATNTMLAERGIPLGQEIDNDVRGNLERQFATADTGAAASAWNAVPGMQATMTNTAINQAMAPGQLAGQSLGLLGGLGGLVPQAQQPQAAYQAPDYTGLVRDKYNADMQAYQANQAGIGNLLKTVAGVALAPMTGGLSSTLIGSGLNWLSGSGGAAQGGSP